MIAFNTEGELTRSVGNSVAPSGWVELDQSAINGFARLTGEDVLIHVDSDHASAAPFAGMIMHTYLTLGREPRPRRRIVAVRCCDYRVIDGLHKVRLPAPMEVGAQVRLVSRSAERPERRGRSSGSACGERVQGGRVPPSGLRRRGRLAVLVMNRYRSSGDGSPRVRGAGRPAADPGNRRTSRKKEP